MHEYDIREQIKRENRKKLFGKFCIGLIIVAFGIIILKNKNIINPFVVSKVKDNTDLEKLYASGVDYVKVSNKNLEFTGYYKRGADNIIIYNCYVTKINQKDCFVFVPIKNSGKNPEKPESTIKNYSFIARIHEDDKLINMVANDYKLDKKDFIEQYRISNIVLNEAQSEREEMKCIYILFGILITIGIAYGIVSIIGVDEMERNKTIKRLIKKNEDIEKVLDSINKEVKEYTEFDSNKIKLTKTLLLNFDNGNVTILKIDEIKEVKLNKKVKTQYGFVKIGYEWYIKIYKKDKRKLKIILDTQEDGEELEKMIKEKIKKKVEKC